MAHNHKPVAVDSYQLVLFTGSSTPLMRRCPCHGETVHELGWSLCPNAGEGARVARRYGMRALSFSRFFGSTPPVGLATLYQSQRQFWRPTQVPIGPGNNRYSSRFGHRRALRGCSGHQDDIIGKGFIRVFTPLMLGERKSCWRMSVQKGDDPSRQGEGPGCHPGIVSPGQHLAHWGRRACSRVLSSRAA